MKKQANKVQDQHLYGGLHYPQTGKQSESVNHDTSEDTGQKAKQNANQEHAPTAANCSHERSSDEQVNETADQDNSSASFSGSVKSLEALLAGKIAKLDAFKNVLSAELKLSLEAVLVSGAIVLALLVILLGLWLGVNSAVALMVFHFTQSLAWTAAIVMTLNLTLCVVLGLALRKSWSLIGLSQTIAVTTEAK